MIWPQVAAWSDVGRLREINEDRVFYQVLASSDAEPLALCIVADGMGGHLAGEVASHWAVETFKRELAELFVPADPRQTVQLSRSELEALNEDVRRGLRPSDAVMVHRLRIAISNANTAVREYALHRPQEAMGAGSTVTLAVVKGTRAYVANVGDSRAYLLRHGRMLQLTKDHSLVAELVAAGHLAPEDAYTHPQAGVITRCLGYSDQVEADVDCHALEFGDRLMLCSDGLWTSLPEPAMMAEIIQSAPALSVAAHRLVKAANHVGGLDNISVVLLHLMEVPDIPT